MAAGGEGAWRLWFLPAGAALISRQRLMQVGGVMGLLPASAWTPWRGQSQQSGVPGASQCVYVGFYICLDTSAGPEPSYPARRTPCLAVCGRVGACDRGGCAAATQIRVAGRGMHAAVRAALADAVAQAQLLHRALRRWPSPLARAWLAQLEEAEVLRPPLWLLSKEHPEPPVRSMKWHSK